MKISGLKNLIPAKNVATRPQPGSHKKVTDAMIMLIPTAVVPISRWEIDKDRSLEERNELLCRDLITFSSSAFSYLVGSNVTETFLNKTKVNSLKKLSQPKKDLISTVAGLMIYLPMATFGAIKFSKMLAGKKKQEEKQEQKPLMNPFKIPIAEKTVETTFQVKPPTEENPYYQYNIDRHSRCSINSPLWRKPQNF